MNHKNIIIGITGGTGAGKTSALRALRTLGGCVLDCDAVYHEMLSYDEALRRDLLTTFGDVFTPEGTLDRQKLGTAVFENADKLDRLNQIIYRRLPPELQRRAAAQGNELVGLDAVNLLQSGLGALCDRTVGVLADKEDRVRRIMGRDGISEDYARLRISAQPANAYYEAACTDILYNHAAGTEEFEQTALKFFEKLIEQIREERKNV
jgi:L-threonylcarbamoyladenylate synthase